jgi:hypothetical protein
VELRFVAEVIYWRGPAPFLFARMPAEAAAKIAAIASRVSYGWGCIRATARIGDVEWTTSLMPREGSYLVPLKVAVQRQLSPMEVGERVEVSVVVGE